MGPLPHVTRAVNAWNKSLKLTHTMSEPLQLFLFWSSEQLQLDNQKAIPWITTLDYNTDTIPDKRKEKKRKHTFFQRWHKTTRSVANCVSPNLHLSLLASETNHLKKLNLI